MEYRKLIFKLNACLELASSRERNLRLKLLDGKLKPRDKKRIEQEGFYMSGMVSAYERVLNTMGEYTKPSNFSYEDTRLGNLEQQSMEAV